MCLNIRLVVHNFRVGTCCSGMLALTTCLIVEKKKLMVNKSDLVARTCYGVSVTIMMLLFSCLYSKFHNYNA